MCQLAQHYETVLANDLDQLRKLRNEKEAVMVSGTKNGPMNTLMELRKVCGHPWLSTGTPFTEPDAIYYRRLINECGKLRLLDRMLTKFKARGHRVIIFSQFTSVLNLLEQWLQHRRSKEWYYTRVDGQVPPLKRQARIDEFNAKHSNIFAFLISTRAGGHGINLQTADTVIIYDSDWNPHNDLQVGRRKLKPVLSIVDPAVESAARFVSNIEPAV